MNSIYIIISAVNLVTWLGERRFGRIPGWESVGIRICL